MGENEDGESGHLSIFTLLKHLMMLLKHNFFRASFLHLTKETDSMKGHATYSPISHNQWTQVGTGQTPVGASHLRAILIQRLS